MPAGPVLAADSQSQLPSGVGAGAGQRSCQVWWHPSLVSLSSLDCSGSKMQQSFMHYSKSVVLTII